MAVPLIIKTTPYRGTFTPRAPLTVDAVISLFNARLLGGYVVSASRNDTTDTVDVAFHRQEWQGEEAHRNLPLTPIVDIAQTHLNGRVAGRLLNDSDNHVLTLV